MDIDRLAEVAFEQLGSMADGDGFSLHPATITSPESIGWMVAYEQHEEVVDVRLASVDRLKLYLVNHELTLGNPDTFFGGWVDEGQLYLDTSQHIVPARKAVRLGVVRRQLGIYSLATNSTVDIRILWK